MTVAASRPDTRLRYDPALDGIRALGVGLVLLFHGGVSWATGGFLGVSVFFTLSGFLITSLLLAEQASGGVRLGNFWSRRLRRLMPAALACLVLIVVLAATALPTARDTLAGDVGAALADVANWRFYVSGQSYAALFAVPSPVQHYWSLAIEEQFYLVFPLLVWLVLTRLRWSHSALAGLLGGAFAAAALAELVIGRADADLVYYATFTRAGELLAGCLLALAVARWERAEAWARPGWWAAIGGPVALATVVFIVARASERDAWLYEGGLAAFSLLSVALITTARRPGPLRWALTRRPVVGLGLISYGVYLYHWPLFLWLTSDRTGLDGPALFGVRAAVTLAVAGVSYRYLEQPIRRGRALTGWRGALVPPVAVATIFAVALPVAAGGAAATSAFAHNSTRVTLPPLPASTAAAPTTAPVATSAVTTSAPAATTAPAATAPRPPVRVVVFGDSTAEVDAGGFIAWGADTGQAVVSDAGTIAGCGLVRSAQRTFGTQRQPVPDGCKAWATWWPQILAATPADVAVVIDGPWELTEQQIPGDRFRSLGDPVFDRFVHDELLAATDVLLAHAPVVVWFTNPATHPGWGATPANQADPVNDADKMARLNDIIRSIVAERPGVVLVDLAGRLASIPGADTDQSMRPDGVHFSPAVAYQMAAWFGPQVVAAGRPG